MKTRTFGICAALAIGLAASTPALKAQEPASLVGVWDVKVTVTNCETGALIRTVRSVQDFHADGSVIETADISSRSISEGTWHAAGRDVYDASYYFFRYTTAGTFASIARVLDEITLDGNAFTSKGTVQDFDATGASISLGCFVHSARRID